MAYRSRRALKHGSPISINRPWRQQYLPPRSRQRCSRRGRAGWVPSRRGRMARASPRSPGSQQLGADGLIHPGKFVQVELMLKDAHRYKGTEGWGWGRWRGVDLKPYGDDAHFVNECTGCHQPVRGNDYVYTLPITTATLNRAEAVNNSAAELPANLPYRPLTWNAITMYVDPKTHTMATLYGNPAAMEEVQMRGAPQLGRPKYPTGAVLALVTWAQRDDPHWFGGASPPYQNPWSSCRWRLRGRPSATSASRARNSLKNIPQRASQHNGQASCSVSLRHACRKLVVGRLGI